MYIRCPNNPDHKEFAISAHIVQLWKVDQRGDYLDVLEDCLDVSCYPDFRGNTVECVECEEAAEILEKEPSHLEQLADQAQE